MSRRSRSLITYLAAAVLVLSVACSDDGPGDTSDAGNDADMGSPDIAECTVDEDCGDLETCNDSFQCEAISCTPGENVDDVCGPFNACKPNDEGGGGTCVECVENTDCTEESNTFCNAENICESFQPECTSAGQSCDQQARPGDGFACIETSNEGPKCVRFYADQNACGNNQLCLGVNPDGFPENENPEKGVCFAGECNGPLDTTSCENITQNVLFGENFPNGAKCVRLSTGGDTSGDFCAPAGTATEGEACNANFCQDEACEGVCAEGLACQGGTCTPYCESDGDCSQSGETCIGEDNDGIVSAGVGFCGETCTPFSRGECSGDKGCQVVDDELGYCREVGNKGYRAPCESTTECADGLTCFGFCAPPCQSPPGTVEEGDRFQYDTTCRGNIRARFLHVADGAGEVDIWYQDEKLVDNVNFGDVTDAAPGVGTPADFYELVPGLQNTEFAVTDTSASDASNPIVSYSDQLLSGLKWTVSIYNGTNGATLHRVPAPRLQPETGNGEVVVRAVHEVTGLSNNVDVVAAPINGGNADLTSAVELAADVGLEAVGEYKVVSAGTYDVYVFPTGAVRDEGNQLATVEGITLDAGKSIYLHGDAGTGVSATAIRATKPGHTPKLRCWNRGLSAGAEAPGGAQGICIERCELSDYGKDNCATFPDPESQFGTIQSACTPLQGENDFIGCLATDGSSDLGGTCEGDADCAEGLFCQTGGAQSGTCQSQCLADTSTSIPTALECPSGTECSATEAGNFGTCQTPCTPNSETDLTDPSCPENLKNCIPERFDDSGNAINAFCQASGSRTEGETCGSGTSEDSLLRQNCQPGLFCTHAEGSPQSVQRGYIGQWLGRPDEVSQSCVPYDPPAGSAQCRQQCDPFPGSDGDSGCADGKSCLPDLTFSSPLVTGVCIDDGEDIADDSTSEPCGIENVGLMCGQASACILSGDSPVCLKFCTSDDNCSGRDVCSASPDDNAVGTCGPPDN